MKFLCYFCVYENFCFTKVISHYRNIHENLSDFKIPCLLSNKCRNKFSSTRTFLKHCRNKHETLYFTLKGKISRQDEQQLQKVRAMIQDVNVDPIALIDFNNADSCVMCEIYPSNDDFVSEDLEIDDFLMETFLRAHHDFLFTKEACSFLFNQLAESANIGFHKGRNTNEPNSFKEHCLQHSKLSYRKKAVLEMKEYIQASTISIDKNGTNYSFQYVSILKTLQELLGIRYFKEYIFATDYDKEINSDTRKDYIDGLACKKMIYFQRKSLLSCKSILMNTHLAIHFESEQGTPKLPLYIFSF